MITTDLAAKKVLRATLTGTVKLIIEDKQVAICIYRSQKHRQSLLGNWYTKYQLQNISHIISIKPTI